MITIQTKEEVELLFSDKVRKWVCESKKMFDSQPLHVRQMLYNLALGDLKTNKEMKEIEADRIASKLPVMTKLLSSDNTISSVSQKETVRAYLKAHNNVWSIHDYFAQYKTQFPRDYDKLSAGRTTYASVCASNIKHGR